jgi:uncharacterized damage-inducible protein DinB
MNYYGAKELADSFRTVRQNTVIIAGEIPEDHYGFKPSPESGTVAHLLVHLAVTPGMQQQIHGVEHRDTLVGFKFQEFFAKATAEGDAAAGKAQIITLLQERGERFAHWVESLSEDFLGERVAMFPGVVPASKSRFEMILGVKEHEMHHRGQLMVIERMLGMVPHITRNMQARMAQMQNQTAAA